MPLAKERILQVADFKGIKRKDFLKKIGSSYSNFTGNSKKSSPSIDIINEITSLYNDISPEWLLTGEGTMLRAKDIKKNIITPKNNIEHIELPNGHYIMKVPLIPFEAHAQYLSDYEDAAYFETFDEVTFIVERVGKGNYKAFKVKGDSMNGGKIDDTEDGAVVLARELQQQHWKDGFRDTKYGWIIITHYNILFKDIKGFNIEKGEIVCHSRNNSPEYSDFDLSLDEVHQIFSVIKRTF